jgi:hypothetical protein
MYVSQNKIGRLLKMKNKWFLGIGVLLACGFILVGCASEANPSSGTTPQPKFLTITGVPAGYSAILGLSVYGVEGRSDVAVAAGWLADLGAGEHDITYSIHVGEDPWDNAVPWTGSGEYVVWIDFFQSDSQDSKRTYFYGGGTGDIIPFHFTDKTPSKTVAWNQFVEVWW